MDLKCFPHYHITQAEGGTGSGDLSLNTLQLTNKQLIPTFIVTKTVGLICYLKHTQIPTWFPHLSLSMSFALGNASKHTI